MAESESRGIHDNNARAEERKEFSNERLAEMAIDLNNIATEIARIYEAGVNVEASKEERLNIQNRVSRIFNEQSALLNQLMRQENTWEAFVNTIALFSRFPDPVRGANKVHGANTFDEIDHFYTRDADVRLLLLDESEAGAEWRAEVDRKRVDFAKGETAQDLTTITAIARNADSTNGNNHIISHEDLSTEGARSFAPTANAVESTSPRSLTDFTPDISADRVALVPTQFTADPRDTQPFNVRSDHRYNDPLEVNGLNESNDHMQEIQRYHKEFLSLNDELAEVFNKVLEKINVMTENNALTGEIEKMNSFILGLHFFFERIVNFNERDGLIDAQKLNNELIHYLINIYKSPEDMLYNDEINAILVKKIDIARRAVECQGFVLKDGQWAYMDRPLVEKKSQSEQVSHELKVTAVINFRRLTIKRGKSFSPILAVEGVNPGSKYDAYLISDNEQVGPFKCEIGHRILKINNITVPRNFDPHSQLATVQIIGVAPDGKQSSTDVEFEYR